MPRAATAFVEFEGDFSKIQRGAGAQAKGLEGTFNSSFSRIARFAAASLATIGVGKVLKDSFKEAEEAQKVQKQTAAVIKSTGGAAGVSAKQVDKLSTSLSAISGIDDEVIASAENVLLTFTNVRNEVGKGNDIFTQGTKAALDLSSALGTDLQGSVIQIGKALNDPIKGVTALQRVGVSFTAQQRDQIKTLVASGRTLDAQKLILRELSKEFGGAAAAAATPSQKIAVAFKNIEEALGGLVLPLFEKLASFTTVTLAPALERVTGVVKDFGSLIAIAFKVGFGEKTTKPIHGWLAIFAGAGVVVRAFVDFVRATVIPALERLGRFFARNGPTIKAFAVGALGAVVAAGKRLGPVLINLGRGLAAIIGWFRKNADVAIALIAPLATLYLGLQALMIVLSIQKAFMAFRAAIVAVNAVLLANPIILVVAGLVALGAAVFLAYKHFGPFHDAVDRLWQILQSTFRWVQSNWPLLLAILTGPVGLAVRFIVQHFDQIKGFVSGAIDFVKSHWTVLLAILTGPIGLAVLAISRNFDSIVGFATGLPGRVAGVFAHLWDGLTSSASAAKNWVGARLHDILSFVTGLPAKIGKAAGGMFDGIENAFRSVVNGIAHLWNSTIGKLSFRVPKWVPKFGGKGFDVPDIPTLDAGAVITSPTFALLAAGSRAQPEIVSPERRIREIVTEVLAVELRDHPGAGLPPLVNNWYFNGRPVLEEVEAISRKQGMAVAIRGRG